MGDISIQATSHNKIIQHINKTQRENHLIISIDSDKAFDKVQHSFRLKVLKKLRLEADITQPNIGHKEQIYSQDYCELRELNAFALTSEKKQGSPLSFDVMLKVLEQGN